jgi:hypothetical protein
MKKTIILLTFFFIIINLNAQVGSIIYTDSNNFESPNIHLQIDTSQNGNIWQIGAPIKPIFNSAYSPTHAIVTDTLNNTPQNNLSSFTLKFFPNFWGSGKLSFWHQFQTDSLNAGGYIDVSYNGGLNWENIVFDTLWWIMTTPTNFYGKHDTIFGNTPAFTGESNGWQFAEFGWIYTMLTKWEIPSDSILIRFNFKSNNIALPKEGWIIDNITYNGYDVIGITETNNISKGELAAFPNPFNDFINIESKTALNSVQIFSTEGKLVYNFDINKKHSLKISTNALEKGIYFLKSVDINNNNYFNKIIKTN